VSPLVFLSSQFGRDDDGILSKKLCGQRKLAPISDLMSASREAESNQNEHNLNLVEALIPEGPEATTFNDPGGELHIWFRKTSRKVNQTVQPLRLKVVITAYKQSKVPGLLFYFGQERKVTDYKTNFVVCL
jgi:hypothetical protein